MQGQGCGDMDLAFFILVSLEASCLGAQNSLQVFWFLSVEGFVLKGRVALDGKRCAMRLRFFFFA